MKQKWLVIGLCALAVLGSASGWVYYAVANKASSVSQAELVNLQFSFIKQYGSDATIKETINPKIYEVAWTDAQGNSNVSMYVGGVWVLIASTLGGK